MKIKLRWMALSLLATLFAIPGLAAGSTFGLSKLEADATRCLQDIEIAEYLKQAWSEVPVALGNLDNGNQTTLYLSRQGTWTLVEHRNDGRACIEAHGSNMRLQSNQKS